MLAAVGEPLVVLRDWPLDFVAPVGVLQEAGAHGVVLWRPATDWQMDARHFGCSAWAL